MPEIVFTDELSNKCFWNKCTYCNINKFKSERCEVGIGMGINEYDAMELKELVEQSIGYKMDFDMQRIGVVVTVHTGPYLMDVTFVKKNKNC